jgi:hypothetical protein
VSGGPRRRRGRIGVLLLMEQRHWLPAVAMRLTKPSERTTSRAIQVSKRATTGSVVVVIVTAVG